MRNVRVLAEAKHRIWLSSKQRISLYFSLITSLTRFQLYTGHPRSPWSVYWQQMTPICVSTSEWHLDSHHNGHFLSPVLLYSPNGLEAGSPILCPHCAQTPLFTDHFEPLVIRGTVIQTQGEDLISSGWQSAHSTSLGRAGSWRSMMRSASFLSTSSTRRSTSSSGSGCSVWAP